jgi:hypothetical protein
MLTDRRNSYQSNGTMKMSMTMLRGAFLSLVLAAFAMSPSQAQAKCDPAADPDCKAAQTKKKEQPKKETADAPKPKKDTGDAPRAKKNTSSSETPADQGSERKKPKKSASSEDRTEQITEENRAPAPKATTSGHPARVNPVEFDKATGKHCSGQDEFRVCW